MNTSTLVAIMALSTLPQGTPSEPARPFPGTTSQWKGYTRHDFSVGGRNAIVVEPKTALPGRPWAWRGEFFGAFPDTDLALLARGWHIAYLAVPDLFGAPRAIERWEEFHDQLVRNHGLAAKPALIGLSRGALYCMAWAARHPEKTLLVYLDNGVCDFKSWPGGKLRSLGTGEGSAVEWPKLLAAYGFKNDQEAIAYEGNPVDRLAPLATARIPLILVYGDHDTVVPHTENSERLYERYKAMGGPVVRFIKPGQNHHPHGLADPTPVVDLFERAREGRQSVVAPDR
ncbi:MAG: alpha/beta hydrolase [Isosphaeraceae bacterium]